MHHVGLGAGVHSMGTAGGWGSVSVTAGTIPGGVSKAAARFIAHSIGARTSQDSDRD